MDKLKQTRDFIYYTYKDFESVWEDKPNVLIWSAVIGVLLFMF